MNSPHWLITEQLKAALTTWAAANWAEAEVVSGFLVERFNQIVEGTDGGVLIALIPTAVIDDADGQAAGMDQDLVTVSILVLQRLENTDTATIVAADALTNQMRRHIKGLELTAIDIDDSGNTSDPERRSVQYLAIFDHDDLGREVFASAIQAEYAVCTGEY